MEDKEFERMAGVLRSRLVLYVRRFDIGADDAEDTAQDVILRLWQLRAELDTARPLEPLAFTIARRLVFNAFRHKHVKLPDSIMQVVDDRTPGPQEQLENTDNEEWLDERLKSLPETWQAILYMRQVERRSSNEIASLLGIKETSVRTLLARARKRLFDELQKFE